MIAGLICLGSAPHHAEARPGDPRVDSEGRERAHYPPDRHFDHLHMRLDLDIPTMSEPRARGVETLTITPVGKARSRLLLNAASMTIESVTSDGRPLTFENTDNLLAIDFRRPVELGRKVDVVITYPVDYGRNRGTGLTWSDGDPQGLSETDRVPQIHSQGQPEYNHTWFPCHDFPNERLTTELFVTVEGGFQVCSNGRLVSRTLLPGGRTTWHWLQDKPHSYYLVLLVVGKFTIVGLETEGANPANPVPNYLYAPIGSEATAKAAYARTPEMMVFFENYFDQPYPWDKYAQLLVRNFAAGGMENTSGTTMQASSAYARAGSQDDIIAHELAHQWTGDLVGYRSWEHLWLGEGWASMGEALWAEHDALTRNGPEAGRRAYQRKIAGFAGMERATNRTYAPMFPGMASRRYHNPMENFIRANNVYAKGAIVLHMLRTRLGDDAFIAGVREYIRRYKFGLAETDDFRRCLEEASGESLERFFDQWTRRPGLPRLEVTFEWDAPNSELAVTVQQKQKIDADNPAYAFFLPIYLTFADGSGRYVYVDSDVRSVNRRFRLDEQPSDMIVDPGMSVVAPTTVHKSLAMWLRQLDHDSIFARLQAIEHLAAFDDPAPRSELTRVALDPHEDELVRAAAGAALVAGRLAQAIGRPAFGRMAVAR